MINKARAREIAYLWHGGQSSALYQFASLGGVIVSTTHKQELLKQVHSDMLFCGASEYYTSRDWRELKSLHDYLSNTDPS